MIPMPNFIAGILIGIANESWWAVLASSFGWGFSYCIYLWIPGQKEKILLFASRAQRLIWGSLSLTFYTIEFLSAALTSLLVGSICFFIAKFWS